MNPTVSIGLAVFDGENYVTQAIGSILRQSHEDLELVITDNASTDGTEEICRAAAASDDRVRYHRNERNLGAVANSNLAFDLSRGRYFKWAAHDDVLGPTFVERCVEALDERPEAVLAFTLTTTIDADGTVTRRWGPQPELCDAGGVAARIRPFLEPFETHVVWGLARRSVLERTPRFGPFPACDRPLLAELALHGPFVQVPERLFHHREHPRRSVRAHDRRRPRDAVAWYDPDVRADHLMPEWRMLAEFGRALGRAPLGWGGRLDGAQELARWAYRHRRALARDVHHRAEALPAVGARLVATRDRRRSRRWEREVGALVADVCAVVDDGRPVVLCDDLTFGLEAIGRRRVLPFLERAGSYHGLPASDTDAVDEIERQRALGAGAFVLPASMAWVTSHYPALRRHLEDRATLASDDGHARIWLLAA